MLKSEQSDEEKEISKIFSPVAKAGESLKPKNISKFDKKIWQKVY
jgi:hypothetical protein